MPEFPELLKLRLGLLKLTFDPADPDDPADPPVGPLEESMYELPDPEPEPEPEPEDAENIDLDPAVAPDP